MLHSMTGFGQATIEHEGLTLKVEIKSLNSKFLDLFLKTPREISDKETEIRNYVQRILLRGKVNLQIELISNEQGNKAQNIDDVVFKTYYSRYKQLAQELGDPTTELFRLALHSPDVISSQEEGPKIEWAILEKVIHQACVACQDFRTKEGQSLAKKLMGYIQIIDDRLEKVKKLDPQRMENIRSRIGKNIDDIRSRVQVDENRFEQELIYYIEKLDITEEKVRLKRHLDYFIEVMNKEDTQGKKLGFISQEIGREINTLGSKANDADIQQLVVEMKDELEKIKEQLLNIL
jgi:uncharacterized protein (TIGR00255 family)